MLDIHPATPPRWGDITRLFGDNGALAGCWCMFPRQRASEFKACAGETNRELFRVLVAGGEEPGLIAYREGEPVGWVALAPREEFGRIERSPVVGPVDDLPGVWATPCFFVHRLARRQGVAGALLDAATRRARELGATAVEGYPFMTPGRRPVTELYVGLETMFSAAGFVRVGGRSVVRCVMRRTF